jgi:hypothetical protein
MSSPSAPLLSRRAQARQPSRTERLTIKIRVIGGTALLGPKLVSELLSCSHEWSRHHLDTSASQARAVGSNASCSSTCGTPLFSGR